jgi:shikimate kinase
MKYFLIGFMGSGKTHWGREWAIKGAFHFIDLDEQIERAVGKTVAQIFEEDGEDFFRQKETEVLKSIKIIVPTIIACGGGTPCFNNNIEWMNENGTTIYLKTTVPQILERVLEEKEKRPLLKNLNAAEVQFFIEKKLKEREPFYNQAEITLLVKDLTEYTILEINNA